MRVGTLQGGCVVCGFVAVLFLTLPTPTPAPSIEAAFNLPSNTKLEIGYALINYTLEVTNLELSNVRPSVPDDSVEWFLNLRKKAEARETPAIRKEYRMMTKEERHRFHRAVWLLKNTTLSDGMPRYDFFQKLHAPKYGPSGVRDAPAQYGWHREYILRFEEALREFDETVSVPYLDLSLDSYLLNQDKSVMFGEDFMGECRGSYGRGQVGKGTFANFPHSDELRNLSTRDYLMRFCWYNMYRIRLTDPEILAIFDGVTTLSQFQDRDCLVQDHDELHHFIGGTTRMFVEGALFDPFSWIMHGLIDFFWEVFRQEIQVSDPETEYPYSDEPLWQQNETMAPFYDLINIDTLSNDYTDTFYIYESAPVSCVTDSDCMSENLWCVTRLNRCQSRLIEGGSCLKYGSSACESGACERGTCSAPDYIDMDAFFASDSRTSEDDDNQSQSGSDGDDNRSQSSSSGSDGNSTASDDNSQSSASSSNESGNDTISFLV